MSIALLSFLPDSDSLGNFAQQLEQKFPDAVQGGVFVVLEIVSPTCPACIWYQPAFESMVSYWNCMIPEKRLGNSIESQVCVRFIKTLPVTEKWKSFFTLKEVPCVFVIHFRKGKVESVAELQHVAVGFLNQAIRDANGDNAAARKAVCIAGVNEIRARILLLVSGKRQEPKLVLPIAIPYGSSVSSLKPQAAPFDELRKLVFQTKDKKLILFPELCDVLRKTEANPTCQKSVRKLLLFGRSLPSCPELLKHWRKKNQEKASARAVAQILAHDIFNLREEETRIGETKTDKSTETRVGDHDEFCMVNNLYQHLEEASKRTELSKEILQTHTHLIQEFQQFLMFM